jgi:hypothetical protein
MSALLPKADISKSALGCPMRVPEMGTKADIANLLGKWPFLASYLYFLLHPISLLLNIFSFVPNGWSILFSG